jgi:hypothetical protein
MSARLQLHESPGTFAMPNFMTPMAIRYVLVSLAASVALIAISAVLIAYGVIEEASSSAGNAVVMVAAWWAGTYFATQTGRVAEWAEAFRISAVLVALQIALSAILSLLFLLAAGPGLAEIMTGLTPGLAGLFAVLALVIGGVYWVATAAFFRMGSKSMTKAKKP